ncbi:unnamed protein product [Dicrocoelium dendriticum]|nr:unnamed protein product [Dicrocoelium dendriticum]
MHSVFLISIISSLLFELNHSQMLTKKADETTSETAAKPILTDEFTEGKSASVMPTTMGTTQIASNSTITDQLIVESNMTIRPTTHGTSETTGSSAHSDHYTKPTKKTTRQATHESSQYTCSSGKLYVSAIGLSLMILHSATSMFKWLFNE